MNASLTLTLTLVLALLAHVALKFWLNARQVRHVSLHRSAVPATYADTVSLADHQKAADYTLAKARLSQIDIALDAAVLLGWTLLGGLDALNQVLLDWMGPGMAQQIALVLGFSLVGGLIGLPLSLMQTFGVEQRFGFNKITSKLWLADMVKGLVLGLALGMPLLWVVLWLMQVGGAWWWLWAWGVLVGWQLFLMAIAPNVIMPLFNKFTPLDDESLKTRVQALMQRAGFTAKGFFVMDGSRRSAHSNAFFTGFGASKRVVFFDTLLKQLSPSEMEAVLAAAAERGWTITQIWNTHWHGDHTGGALHQGAEIVGEGQRQLCDGPRGAQSAHFVVGFDIQPTAGLRVERGREREAVFHIAVRAQLPFADAVEPRPGAAGNHVEEHRTS